MIMKYPGHINKGLINHLLKVRGLTIEKFCDGIYYVYKLNYIGKIILNEGGNI